MPSTLPSTFYNFPEMVTRIAQEYHKNFANHITHNFERFCTNYFFLRLNNDADLWYVADVTVKERRSIASYLYKRVASLEPTWPDIDNDELLQSTFERTCPFYTSWANSSIRGKPLCKATYLSAIFTYCFDIYGERSPHLGTNSTKLCFKRIYLPKTSRGILSDSRNMDDMGIDHSFRFLLGSLFQTGYFQAYNQLCIQLFKVAQM